MQFISTPFGSLSLPATHQSVQKRSLPKQLINYSLAVPASVCHVSPDDPVRSLQLEVARKRKKITSTPCHKLNIKSRTRMHLKTQITIRLRLLRTTTKVTEELDLNRWHVHSPAARWLADELDCWVVGFESGVSGTGTCSVVIMIGKLIQTLDSKQQH